MSIGQSDSRWRGSNRRRAAVSVAVVGLTMLLGLGGVAACANMAEQLAAPGLSQSAEDRASAGNAEYSPEENAYDADSTDGAYGSNPEVVTVDERKLVFVGRMELRVEDTLTAMDETTAWAADHDGFIEQSSTNDWEGDVSGSLTMRVPSESFEDARAYLRSFAIDVLSDEKERQDVTGQYADYRARLDNLRAAESELRDIMAQIREVGGTAEEVLSIYRELTNIRGQIESLQGQLDVLSEQIAYSTIHVSYTPLPADPAIVTDRWRPGYVLRRALGDLVGGFQKLADAAIYITVALLPLLLLIASALWVLVKIYRRLRPKRDDARRAPDNQEPVRSTPESKG